METSLHQSIKRSVARDEASIEVSIGNYRIDAIDQFNRLVEVQHGPLGALRDKVLQLRSEQTLRIIKPIVVRKQVVTLDPKTKRVLRGRKSPKHNSPLCIFQDLIHFTNCFPHPNVILECWLVSATELRFDRPKSRRQRKKYTLHDVQLHEKLDHFVLQTPHDLASLLVKHAANPTEVPQSAFCTQILANWLGLDRWLAQQIAYVLVRCDAIQRCGKRGNSHLYQWSPSMLASPRPRRPARQEEQGKSRKSTRIAA